jgi:hypothetical protein
MYELEYDLGRGGRLVGTHRCDILKRGVQRHFKCILEYGSSSREAYNLYVLVDKLNRGIVFR